MASEASAAPDASARLGSGPGVAPPAAAAAAPKAKRGAREAAVGVEEEPPAAAVVVVGPPKLKPPACAGFPSQRVPRPTWPAGRRMHLMRRLCCMHGANKARFAAQRHPSTTLLGTCITVQDVLLACDAPHVMSEAAHGFHMLSPDPGAVPPAGEGDGDGEGDEAAPPKLNGVSGIALLGAFAAGVPFATLNDTCRAAAEAPPAGTHFFLAWTTTANRQPHEMGGTAWPDAPSMRTWDHVPNAIRATSCLCSASTRPPPSTCVALRRRQQVLKLVEQPSRVRQVVLHTLGPEFGGVAASLGVHPAARACGRKQQVCGWVCLCSATACDQRRPTHARPCILSLPPRSTPSWSGTSRTACSALAGAPPASPSGPGHRCLLEQPAAERQREGTV